jgi:hypothetical protein
MECRQGDKRWVMLSMPNCLVMVADATQAVLRPGQASSLPPNAAGLALLASEVVEVAGSNPCWAVGVNSHHQVRNLFVSTGNTLLLQPP